MDFDDVCDELYGLDPTEFVAARTAQVSAARAAGDKALAARIGKLRKPTVSAWVVNLLAREAPDEVGALLDLGAALQDAQRHLSGADLRALSGQRQKAVSALARRAGALAADRGRPVDENLLREVGQTLNAALADPAVAAQVRSGTTVTAQTYDGFGPSGLAAVPDLTAEPEAQPEPEPPPKPRRPKPRRQTRRGPRRPRRRERRRRDRAGGGRAGAAPRWRGPVSRSTRSTPGSTSCASNSTPPRSSGSSPAPPNAPPPTARGAPSATSSTPNAAPRRRRLPSRISQD